MPLNHIPETFKGFQVWRLGWPCQGLDLEVLHPHLDRPGCGHRHPTGKTSLRMGEHGLNRMEPVFFQNNLVAGFIHAFLTETNLPGDSSFAEAAPDRQQSYTQLRLWLVGLSGLLEDQVLGEAANWTQRRWLCSRLVRSNPHGFTSALLFSASQ